MTWLTTENAQLNNLNLNSKIFYNPQKRIVNIRLVYVRLGKVRLVRCIRESKMRKMFFGKKIMS